MSKKRKRPTTEGDLGEILELIEGAENRAMAVDGPVPATVSELKDSELTKIYRLAERSKRREARKKKRPEDDRRVFLEQLDDEKVAKALHNVAERDVLQPFRYKWEALTKGRRQHYTKAAQVLKTALFKVRAVF